MSSGNEKTLHHQLLDEPYRFEFFQAVRLLEKIFPEKLPVGGDALPDEEVARFRSRMALDFPASEIHELTSAVDDATGRERLEMFINFMGMAGISGVLPTHYTELIMERVRYRDTALWLFLDMFTHRAVGLFFRSWEKYRFPVSYERGNDQFTAFLFDIAGLGTNGLRGRMDLPDESLLPYAGLIAQKPHSATALANILTDYFGIKAKILQFFGQWLNLDSAGVTRLGQLNSGLGTSAIIGNRVWDQQSKFRIVLGPLDFKHFQDFLPCGQAFAPLRSIVHFLYGTEFDFDVQLVLKAKQVPGTVLTTRAKRRPMLGWTSFLKSRPFREDDEQVVLNVGE
jgi:type VI secretion system protein ImpH